MAILATGCALFFLGDRAAAHERHDDPAATEAVLAPGWGPLAFEPPAPGSYALPPLFPAADGRVLDADGTETTLHAVYGDSIVLLSFVFASCTDVNGCPLATSVLQRVQHRVAQRPDLAERIRLVSLSFDPARDTPEVMRKYGETFARPGVDWTFLTTRGPEQLAPILAAYDQSITQEIDADGRSTGSFAHILRVFLIDTRRNVRNVYTVSFLHPDTLLNDVETVLASDAGASTATADAQSDTRQSILQGSGDVRAGYDAADYRSRSASLASRKGRSVDLLARTRPPPQGLPAVPIPPSNPLTSERVRLGRKLFFDRRLSHNGTISCAMCHVPEQGFTNNEIATAVGIEGRTVRRNAPTLYNVAYVRALFHDGRATTLESQVWGPLLARNEMGNAAADAVTATVRSLPDYDGLFEAAFGDRGPSPETIGMALASYERTLVSGSSKFDRWHFSGEAEALSAAARRGFALFTGAAGCASCHTIERDFALFSDGEFHNTGIGVPTGDAPTPARQRIAVGPGRFLEVDSAIVDRLSGPIRDDLGRFEVTQQEADRWRYRTPSLRNVALTSPYMHDGSLATLREVVAFYDRGGVPNPGLDPRIRPLGLDTAQVADLLAFLDSLTGGDVDALVGDAFAAPIGESRTTR